MGIIGKTAVIWAILFFIAAMITVQAAYSARSIDIDSSGVQCTKNGRLRFNFLYSSGEGDMDLDDVTVYADGKEVKGAWYKHVDDPKQLGSLISYVEQGKRAMFYSDYCQFNEKGKYAMNIVYPDEGGSMSSEEFKISCPGFLFACEIFEISMDRCYNSNGKLVMEFSGSGFGDFGANLTKDFSYYLKGNTKRHEGTLESMNAEISKAGDGSWIVAVPLEYSVSWAYLRGKPYGCDRTIKGDYYETITYKKCTTEASAPAEQPSAQAVTGAASLGIAEEKEEEISSEPAYSGSASGINAEPSLLKKILGFIVSIFAR